MFFLTRSFANNFVPLKFQYHRRTKSRRGTGAVASTRTYPLALILYQPPIWSGITAMDPHHTISTIVLIPLSLYHGPYHRCHTRVGATLFLPSTVEYIDTVLVGSSGCACVTLSLVFKAWWILFCSYVSV